MATYNEPSETISDSIESLIHQDYQHLEILIADDSTQAETIRTIDQFAERDKRIIVIRSEKRMGFVTALNTAMRKAKGELLARMDGDDISLPDRISKQVDYAKSNPEIDIFGGSMYIINEQGETISQRNYPITKWGIYKMFLFRSPFAHPTIMFRRSIIDGGIFYDSKYKKAEIWKNFTNITAIVDRIPGDVNIDGEVNIADVNTVIDVILSNGHNMDADVNGDHEVNIADVNAEIDMILNK